MCPKTVWECAKKMPTKLLNKSLKCVPMFVPAELLFLSEISFRLEVWVTRVLPERFTTA